MKKLVIVATSVVLTATFFASCKKDYNCTCTITTGGTNTTQVIPIKDETKSKAKDACDAAKTTYTTSFSTASCSLD